MNKDNYSPTEIFPFYQIGLLSYPHFDASYLNVFAQIEFFYLPSK